MSRENIEDATRVTIATFKLKKPILNFPEGYRMHLTFDFKDDRTTSGPYYHLELTGGPMGEYKLPPSVITDKEFFELEDCMLNDMLENLRFGGWIYDHRLYNLKLNSWEVEKYLDKDFHEHLAKLFKINFKVTRVINEIRVSIGKEDLLN